MFCTRSVESKTTEVESSIASIIRKAFSRRNPLFPRLCSSDQPENGNKSVAGLPLLNQRHGPVVHRSNYTSG